MHKRAPVHIGRQHRDIALESVFVRDLCE